MVSHNIYNSIKNYCVCIFTLKKYTCTTLKKKQIQCYLQLQYKFVYLNIRITLLKILLMINTKK